MVGRYRSVWRWSNVPVPEPHVAGLVVGTVLHGLKPMAMVRDRRRARILGVGLSSVGLLFIWWAIRVTGEVDVETPAVLVTSGPYAVSRNPMYVGWSVLYLGVALLVNTIWLFVLFPVVVAFSHGIIHSEERALERRFGDTYRTYERDVPRYL